MCLDPERLNGSDRLTFHIAVDVEAKDFINEISIVRNVGGARDAFFSSTFYWRPFGVHVRLVAN